jgi:hypothetical protein
MGKIINHPLEWWDEAAYRSSRFRNKLPRFVVERAVRITFRRRIASFWLAGATASR